ncbi:MAG: hypothetical protein LC676_10770 [Loktanella sp.]|nr:hypothetical protein [Loktanella sp.]
MNRYTVFSNRDACDNPFWTVWDRVARATIGEWHYVKADAMAVSARLNEGNEYCC